MTTIALLNLKGGVGKTSTCYHVGGALARAGHRVLLVDLDPQASLTQGFLGPRAAHALPAGRTVAALYDPGGAPPPEALVMPVGPAGSSLDLLPGSPELGRTNMTPPEGWAGHQDALRDALVELAERPAPLRHDVVLVDCPPNLYLCSWAALVAADAVVVPVQPEDFGSQGLAPVQAAIAHARAGPNPSLRLAGYLLTMVDRRLTVHAAYEARLREKYGGDVFAAVVPRAKDFVEAVAGLTPVGDYKPRGAAAKAAAAVGAEMVARATRAAGHGVPGAHGHGEGVGVERRAS